MSITSTLTAEQPAAIVAPPPASVVIVSDGDDDDDDDDDDVELAVGPDGCPPAGPNAAPGHPTGGAANRAEDNGDHVEPPLRRHRTEPNFSEQLNVVVGLALEKLVHDAAVHQLACPFVVNPCLNTGAARRRFLAAMGTSPMLDPASGHLASNILLGVPRHSVPQERTAHHVRRAPSRTAEAASLWPR
jgi:hypothetical protein